ncbi:peptidylprolyl isomerase [Prosthecobacter dejongeii]|uniref:peptidylprolyl isomerase n=1 Tax=Prosthecobacter dejongeii TaxID=48465 RepID=UPI00161BF411|nr:peptidylprolyl isomerase [Prosthecobacter dejongeii]
MLIALCQFKEEPLRRFLLGSEQAIAERNLSEEVAQLQFRGLAANTAEIRWRVALNIRQQRQREVTFHPDVSTALEKEMQAWRRQWEKSTDRDQRLIGQGLTERLMENRVKEALLDQAWVEAQMAQSGLVTANELQAAYQATDSALKLPQMQRIEHLFLAQSGLRAKDRSVEMRKLHQRLLRGEDWAGLVQTHSEDARTQKKQGDLGWLGISRTPQAVIQAALSMQTGQVSSPIQSELGWHIIRLIQRKDERLPQLNEVRAELTAILQANKRQAALERITEKLPLKPASD